MVGEKTQCQDNLVQVRRIVVQHGLCPWAEETLRRLRVALVHENMPV